MQESEAIPRIYEWSIRVEINSGLYLKDPESSEIGRKILVQGVRMIDKIGLEEFTFGKLAKFLRTTESTIYRYFESKHRLLLYLIQWYWRWMDFQLVYNLRTEANPDRRLDLLIQLLLHKFAGPARPQGEIPSPEALHRIVIHEGSKAYLTRQVDADNRRKFFKPYKDFCGTAAEVIAEIAPGYPFCRSLSSTLIEMAHFQPFFREHLPALTDSAIQEEPAEVSRFLRTLVLGVRTAQLNSDESGV